MIFKRLCVLQIGFLRILIKVSASALLIILLLVNAPEAWGNDCCTFHGGADYCLSQSGEVVCKDGTICSSCECVPARWYFAGKNHNLTSGELNNKYVLVEKGYREKMEWARYNSADKLDGDDESKKRNGEYLKNKYLLIEFFAGIEKYYFNINSRARYPAAQEIEAEVKPVTLGYVQVNASIPLIFFKGIYKYEFKKEGGTVNSGREEYINSYIDRDKLKRFLNLVGGVFGFELSYQTECFNFGKYRYYTLDYINGDGLPEFRGEFPFQVTRDQIQIKYHLLWHRTPRLGGVTGKDYPVDFFLGYRYLRMNMPGIIYELNEDRVPVGESLPQNIPYKIHYGGIGLGNSEMLPNPGLNLYWGLEFYFGMGEARVNIDDFTRTNYTPSIKYEPVHAGVHVRAYDIGGNLGWLINFVQSYLFMSLKIEYSVNASIINIISTRNGHSLERSKNNMAVSHSVKLSGEITF